MRKPKAPYKRTSVRPFLTLLAGLTSIAANASGIVEPPAIAHPNWENQTIAQHDFIKKGDERVTVLDREKYSLNPMGAITGRELLDLVRPMSFSDFQAMAKARDPKNPDAGSMIDYQSYLTELLNEALPVLSLNRILDNEAMKRRIDSEVSDSRVIYIFNAVMAQNAITAGKIKETDDSTRLSGEQRYDWFKAAVGKNPVRLNMDWRYCDAGLHNFCDSVDYDQVKFPPVKLNFPKVPDTAQEFIEQIRQQLQSTHTVLMRQMVWQKLLQEHNPQFVRTQLFPGTTIEMDRLYESIKEQVFAYRQMHALTYQIKINGTKAKDFKDAFNKKIAEQEDLHKNDTALTQEKIDELRRTVPAQVLQNVLSDFSQDTALGNLSVGLTSSNLDHNSRDDLPSDLSINSQQLQRAFNPLFPAVAVFPWLQLPEGDGYRIMFFEQIVTDQISFIPRNDEQVIGILHKKIQIKEHLSSYREVAYQLFKENPISMNVDFCTALPWPCIYPEAKGMANALFPGEKTFSGQPIQSSLMRPLSLDKVQDISGEIFEITFSVPDAKRN